MSYEPIFDESTAPDDDKGMFGPCDECGGIDCRCPDDLGIGGDPNQCSECWGNLDEYGGCPECDY